VADGAQKTSERHVVNAEKLRGIGSGIGRVALALVQAVVELSESF
jgi:hypothetical protein